MNPKRFISERVKSPTRTAAITSTSCRRSLRSFLFWGGGSASLQCSLLKMCFSSSPSCWMHLHSASALLCVLGGRIASQQVSALIETFKASRWMRWHVWCLFLLCCACFKLSYTCPCPLWAWEIEGLCLLRCSLPLCSECWCVTLQHCPTYPANLTSLPPCLLAFLLLPSPLSSCCLSPCSLAFPSFAISLSSLFCLLPGTFILLSALFSHAVPSSLFLLSSASSLYGCFQSELLRVCTRVRRCVGSPHLFTDVDVAKKYTGLWTSLLTPKFDSHRQTHTHPHTQTALFLSTNHINPIRSN